MTISAGSALAGDDPPDYRITDLWPPPKKQRDCRRPRGCAADPLVDRRDLPLRLARLVGRSVKIATNALRQQLDQYGDLLSGNWTEPTCIASRRKAMSLPRTRHKDITSFFF